MSSFASFETWKREQKELLNFASKKEPRFDFDSLYGGPAMHKCDRDYRNFALYFAVCAEHHERLALQYEQQARQHGTNSHLYHELASRSNQLATQYEQLAILHTHLTTIPLLHRAKPTEESIAGNSHNEIL